MTSKTRDDVQVVVIGIEIVTRRRYAVHARTQADAASLVDALPGATA